MVKLCCALAMLIQLTAVIDKSVSSHDNPEAAVLNLGRMARHTDNLTQARKGFAYKLKIKNTSTKTITALFWEYQFGDASAPQDISRRQFLCSTTIKPGAAKMLEVFSTSPPTYIVSAASAGRKKETKTVSKVVLNRIEYADGTSWERADWTKPKQATSHPADLYPDFHKSKCSSF